MDSTATLTSLALLNVSVNQGSSYLDYLLPFVYDVLNKHRPDPVKSDVVGSHILNEFGLHIPTPTVESVLLGLARRNEIRKESLVYRITGDLPNPEITAKITSAKARIDSVSNELLQYSQRGVKPFANREQAVGAICRFLSSFDVTCLRAALRETVIPRLEGTHRSDIVQVSEFVQHLQRTSPALFEDFLVLVQGNMLANALLCPDLRDAPPTFENVEFYFDTPLLIPLLGLEVESRRTATHELLDLLSKLGGKAFVFSHTVLELERVIVGAANNLNSPEGRGSIVYEARRRGTEKAELLLLAGKLEEKLSELGVHVEETPRYVDSFQIDETALEDVLKGEVNYLNNPNAIQDDIDSVRSIYVLRGRQAAPSIERSRAVLVTSNNAFAKAAWRYGQQYESSRDVSVVIADFSLANLAWLKSPIDAPEVPRSQLLAFAYAALKPSKRLLDKFLSEIDRLESSGSIDARDHQLLRSSPHVYSDLMHLTLGEDAALSGETVMQALERVSDEIRMEETVKFEEEEEAHRRTQLSLDRQTTQNNLMRASIQRRCLRYANAAAWLLTAIMSIIVVVGMIYEAVVIPSHWAISRLFVVSSGLYLSLSLLNIVTGFNFVNVHQELSKRAYHWLLEREAKSSGISISYLEYAEDTE